MRKIKTLTKKSLDELEKVMPRISEIDQHQCVGGDYYYNLAGDLVHQTQGDDMFVIPQYISGDIRANEAGYQAQCTPFGQAPKATQLKVVTRIARDWGFEGSVVIDTALNFNASPNAQAAYDHKKNKIGVMESGYVLGDGNFNDLKSVIFHEVVHANTPHLRTKASRELAAYWAQLNHPSYNHLTIAMQGDIFRFYENYYKAVANSSEAAILSYGAYGDGRSAEFHRAKGKVTPEADIWKQGSWSNYGTWSPTGSNGSGNY